MARANDVSGDAKHIPAGTPTTFHGSTRPPTPGQFLEEEGGRGRINGGIVMPDEPTFTQFKNGVTTAPTEERLTFETDVAAKEVTRGNRSSHSAGY